MVYVSHLIRSTGSVEDGEIDGFIEGLQSEAAGVRMFGKFICPSRTPFLQIWRLLKGVTSRFRT